MHLLFCQSPLDARLPDPDFQEEWDSARAAGFTCHLFDVDRPAVEGTRKIMPALTLQPILYRGWMRKPKQYQALYEALLAKNYQLINTPVQYQHCHYLPDSYPFIKAHTPATYWFPYPFQYEAVFNSIAALGHAPMIVKDYVKSQKHYWHTACYIPDAMDQAQVKQVIATFLALQGDDLNEGIVLRAFVPLQTLTYHSKSGMPLQQEYRLFFFRGQLLGSYDYWEEGHYPDAAQPPLDFFTTVARQVDSHFFSMDIALTEAGEWIIVELGDGQVSGLPDKADKDTFYKLLAQQA